MKRTVIHKWIDIYWTLWLKILDLNTNMFLFQSIISVRIPARDPKLCSLGPLPFWYSICWWHCFNLYQLSEVFEQEIDPVMQSLGYCCGRKYTFNPQVLCCYGKQLCTIPRDAKYFSYQNRYVLVNELKRATTFVARIFYLKAMYALCG